MSASARETVPREIAEIGAALAPEIVGFVGMCGVT